MNKPNSEIKRFVDLVGGNAPASKILNITPDMVRKLKEGEREFKAKYVRIMYKHRGFKLSFIKLFDL